MRRTAILLSALTLIAGLSTGTASATTSAATDNCNHYTGGGTAATIRSADDVQIQGNGARVGAVQLCRNGSEYWGYMVLDNPMASGKWGTAAIWQYRNGVRITAYHCATPPQGSPDGGNDHIIVGQTRCWTRKIVKTVASDTFAAYGVVYRGDNIRDAWGQTATVG
jgi:hypothetical protein